MTPINKERYLGLLENILSEHYRIIKDTGIITIDRQQYIDGYLTAVRALDAIDYDELKTFIEKVHFEVFGMSIEERRTKIKVKPGTAEDDLEIPAYVRQGTNLEF